YRPSGCRGDGSAPPSTSNPATAHVAAAFPMMRAMKVSFSRWSPCNASAAIRLKCLAAMHQFIATHSVCRYRRHQRTCGSCGSQWREFALAAHGAPYHSRQETYLAGLDLQAEVF